MKKMNLEIWENPKKDDKVRIKVSKDDYGDINVRVVNSNGESLPGNFLFYIDSKTGKIKLNDSINPDLGFDLDDNGRIKFVGDGEE